MGLDMYALTTDKTVEQTVDFSAEGATEFYYWRKHPNLHGWMQRLYFEKGGQDDTFNCATVKLCADDLDALVEEMDDVSGFDDLGEAGSFDDLDLGDDLEPVDEPASDPLAGDDDLNLAGDDDLDLGGDDLLLPTR